MRITDFSVVRPKYQTDQHLILDWIADAHAQAEATLKSLDADGQRDFAARMRRVIARFTGGPDHIQNRGHVIPDVGRTDWDQAIIYDLRRHPHGQGAGARARFYDKTVTEYFEAEYRDVATPPSDLIHVTCTGYVSPSAAQKLVAGRGWGATTRVTHAYHMGCYAAFPALRMAVGGLSTAYPVAASPAPRRTDVVHTELCSLHFDPGAHDIEQLVVQTLFADGFIRYSVLPDDRGEGLRLLALDEQLLPNSAQSMTWVASDLGMTMTLARDVPQRIAGALRGQVTDVYRRAGIDPAEIKNTVFAIHPGGPKIIDGVRKVLELDDAQVAASQAVLRAHGNMSSATLPHLWARLAADRAVAPGTLIASLAFGPGLTMCAALFRKQ